MCSAAVGKRRKPYKIRMSRTSKLKCGSYRLSDGEQNVGVSGVGPLCGGGAAFQFADQAADGILQGEDLVSRLERKKKPSRIYKEQLPKITPHVCRHTYCSNMAKSGMNPKTLQYLMGHSDIGVILNTYTHLGAEDAKEELGKYAKMD